MSGIYILVLIILFSIFLFLAKKSEILRDSISDKSAFDKAAGNNKNARAPYSLSRTQLAFWTIIIVSSFFYLLVTREFKVPEMDKVNLILLGISMGTTAIASTIDTSQQNSSRHQNLPSEGFLIDILSDKQGISIHRLQNILWTVIVGIIYIAYVSANNVLPDSNTITEPLLVLMGISSGAYLGLKIPENSGKEKTGTENTGATSLSIDTNDGELHDR